jgi:recombinational DNA repair protein RecR
MEAKRNQKMTLLYSQQWVNKINASVLEALILEDFKTVEKKFVDSGVPQDDVKKYLSLYKDAKTKNKIKDAEDLNIDTWGKKPWDEFKLFVDKLSQQKTKSEIQKQEKMEGATLVAENDKWYVYEITEHKACMTYGSGTKWCITQPSGEHWNHYKMGSNFYFLISKTLPKEDKFYKIAMQVDNKGEITYWDATDESHDSLPSKLGIPKFEIKFPEFMVGINGERYTLSQFMGMKNLHVRGYLFLRGSPITSLPEGLNVGGSLDLSGTPITSLPEGLSVGGDLDLSDTPITSLPKGLSVGGDLNLRDTPITSLPEGLSVGGSLNLSDTPITSLPKGLSVGGYLNLRGTPITSLPKGLSVGGYLYLRDTPITSLPEGLSVGGDLDLSDTKVKVIPKSAKIGGDVLGFEGQDLRSKK